MNSQFIFANNISNHINYNVPISLKYQDAIALSKKILYLQYLENYIYQFNLPISYSFLRIGNVILLPISQDKFYLMNKICITKIVFKEDLLKIYGVKYSSDLYSYHSGSSILKKFQESAMFNLSLLSQIKKNSKTLAHIEHLPILVPFVNSQKENFDRNGSIVFACAAQEPNLNWKGASIFEFYNQKNKYQLSCTVSACFGKVIKNLNKSSNQFLIDRETEIIVQLFSGEQQKLNSINQEQFLNFANLAKIGDEIINFRYAIFLGSNCYKLVHMMRGLFGTEISMGQNKVNKNFILLVDNLEFKNIDNLNINPIYRLVTYGDNLEIFNQYQLFLQKFFILNYTVCNLKAKTHLNQSLRYLKISFNFRVRTYDNWENDQIFFTSEASEYVLYKNFLSNTIEQKKVINGYAFLIEIFYQNNLLVREVIENLFYNFLLNNFYDKLEIKISRLNDNEILCQKTVGQFDLNHMQFTDIYYEIAD